MSIKSIPILSTKRTRSGRLVVPKKFDDEIIGDVCLDDVLETSTVSKDVKLVESSSGTKASKTNEEKSSEEVVVSKEQSEKVLKSNAVNTNVAKESRELEGLVSVAEAFERSQQPDFNDIANPGSYL